VSFVVERRLISLSLINDFYPCRRTATLLYCRRTLTIEHRAMQIRTPLDMGLVIRHQRRRLGLNQTDLASRVGVGRQWIVAIERGKARAELGLVLRTLAALELTLVVDGGSDATTRKDGSITPIDIDAVVDVAKGRRP
jgi:HTH-type transcriptional regulator / antitoxin HipB